MNSDDSQPDWRRLNRANWDERVPIHLGPCGYDVAGLLNGRAQLNAIEESELGPVVGLRVLHLQCHFRLDTLVLVQHGATAVGLDFSAPAIDAARDLADRLGVAGRVRFVLADLYGATAAIPESSSFDVVFVTWGHCPGCMMSLAGQGPSRISSSPAAGFTSPRAIRPRWCWMTNSAGCQRDAGLLRAVFS